MAFAGVGLGLIISQKIFWISNIIMTILFFYRNNIDLFYINIFLLLISISLYIISLSKGLYCLQFLKNIEK